MARKAFGALQDHPVPIRFRLSALWAATMFCYIYADYFGLFAAGHLAAMNAGNIPPLGPATARVLVFTSTMVIIPSVMIFLALVVPPSVNRWLNVVLGIAYTVIIGLTMRGAPPFYLLFGTVEVALTLTVAITAWQWPRMAGAM